MMLFIAGQHRSGSTFSFNIARETLLLCGSVGHATDNSLRSYADSIATNDHFILKSHALDDEALEMIRNGNAKAIITKREPQEAIASLIDTFGFDRKAALDSYLAWLQMYRAISANALVVDYELIDARPGRAAALVAKYLDVAIPAAAVAHICKRHTKANVLKAVEAIKPTDENIEDIGFSYYDRTTFYHRRHVSGLTPSYAENRIAADDLDWIRAALAAEQCCFEQSLVGGAIEARLEGSHSRQVE